MDRQTRQKWILAPKIALLCLSAILFLIGNMQAQSAVEVEIVSQIEKLKEAAPQARLNAVRVLKNMGASAVPALTTALQDEENRVRGGAAFALGAMGAEAQAAIPQLIQTLQDRDEQVRLDAAVALRRMGAPAVPALAEALQSEEVNVRRGATFALAGMGAEAQTTVPTLIAALKDNDEQVRLNAAVALRGIGSPAVPALTAALRNADEQVRKGAAFALARVTPDAKTVASNPSPNPCQGRPGICNMRSSPNLCDALLRLRDGRPSICDSLRQPSNVQPSPAAPRPSSGGTEPKANKANS